MKKRPGTQRRETGRRKRTLELFVDENGDLSIANAGNMDMDLIRAISGRRPERRSFYCG